MGEVFGTTIEIGGKIKRSQIAKIEDMLLESICPGFDEAAAQKSVVISNGETNLDGTEELSAYLREHGIAYCIAQDAKYEYDGTLEFFSPEHCQPDEVLSYGCTQDAVPYLTLPELQQRYKDGMTLVDVIHELNKVGSDLPPIEIIDDLPGDN